MNLYLVRSPRIVLHNHTHAHHLWGEEAQPDPRSLDRLRAGLTPLRRRLLGMHKQIQTDMCVRSLPRVSNEAARSCLRQFSQVLLRIQGRTALSTFGTEITSDVLYVR